MESASWLIGRQPILDREERVWGYELLFRDADDPALPDATRASADATRASADVILGTLSGMGLEALLGGKRGFVNVARELLHSDALLLLPPQWMVIELLESIEPDEALLARCRALRGAGFALALDDHRYDARFEPIYPWVDLVKVDLTLFRPDELAAEVRRLRAWPPRLVAEKVETAEQFRACRDLGFDYFQGYHFARPALVERKKLPDGGSSMLRLMGLLQEDADTSRVEAAFRQSPGLTYRLLVLVNSVAVGSRERIRSVRQAITLLGRKQLRRWVQLALFSADGPHGLDDPLLDAAAVRASFLEELCRLHPRLRGAADAPEQGFLVGILSLLGRSTRSTWRRSWPSCGWPTPRRRRCCAARGRWASSCSSPSGWSGRSSGRPSSSSGPWASPGPGPWRPRRRPSPGAAPPAPTPRRRPTAASRRAPRPGPETLHLGYGPARRTSSGGQAPSSAATVRSVPGTRCSGQSSASGASAKARSGIAGWGTWRPGSSMRSSP